MLNYILAVVAGLICGVVIGEIHGVHINPSTAAVTQIARENHRHGYQDGVKAAMLEFNLETVERVNAKLREKNKLTEK